MTPRARERREFLLGVLWGAWYLHRNHGEDTMAGDLLCSTAPLSTFRRLAHAEDYHFTRGFWAETARHSYRQRTRT